MTGGAQGVGKAIAHALARDGHVVVLDVAETVDADLAAHERVKFLAGDAADPDRASAAAALAESAAPLFGWVNNAAVFRDADLRTATAPHVLEPIAANLAPT
ncbi:MAG TPA: SDR family NAD(P)-dependent oxidoreductase, partial [Jatrophihabitantaceae bacterium]|nr:SDR family NAD(P)-dependent oxidoreductase [Jatrophihabitantaceae bacterium]